MKKISNSEPIKFDFQSIRERCLTCLMVGGIIIGILLVFIFIFRVVINWVEGLGGILIGFAIVYISVRLFAALIASTDDHLLVDPQSEYVLLSTMFLFKKK